MPPSGQLVTTVDERNDARMHFRTKPSIKATIHKAAILSGLDDSSFALQAAYQAAVETIAAQEKTHLEAEDHAVFFCCTRSRRRTNPCVACGPKAQSRKSLMAHFQTSRTHCPKML